MRCVSLNKAQIRCLICLTITFLVIEIFFLIKDNLYFEAFEPEIKSLGNFKIPHTQENVKAKQTDGSSCDIVIAIILCQAAETPVRAPTKSALTNDKNNKVVVAKDFSRQIDQLIVLLKSILISMKYSEIISPNNHQHSNLGSDCIKVLIISDSREHYDSVLNIIYDVEEWDENFMKLLKFVYYPVTYPTGTDWMRTLFRPCATLRLFLPDILPTKYKSIIYLDTDIIFLKDLKELWGEFEEFTDETIGSMSPCLFHYGSKSNKIPFYGKSGLNAGIMLMNLTRMRETLWTNKIKMITEIYQHKIKLADQDILNIYFYYFPHHLHEFSCTWNFRPWNCRTNSECNDVNSHNSLSALHGNALSFTKDGIEPWFYKIFQHFKQTELNSQFSIDDHMDNLKNVLETYDKDNNRKSGCRTYNNILLNQVNKLRLE